MGELPLGKKGRKKGWGGGDQKEGEEGENCIKNRVKGLELNHYGL